MKTSLLLGAALAFLGLAAAPLSAQTQSTTSTTTSSSGYIQTSKIIGTKVKASNGEEIGVVKDVVIDRSTGCMAYTVVSAGGTGTRITGQAKTVAVPWAVYSTTSDPSVLTVTVERDRIYNAPVFDYARITEYTTPAFIGNVYSYYGVSAGGVSGAAYGTSVTGAATTTTGTTTATGATATTGASATPMGSASPVGTPAATATPAATPMPGRSPAMSPAATAAASPRATASPRERREAGREEGERGRGKARMSPAASPEERTGRPETGTSPEAGMSPSGTERTRGAGVREKAEESPAETGASPAGERKKAKRPRGEESPTTGASPGTTEEQE
jgi:sporulation protein YlmC with PRC-barrel domain